MARTVKIVYIISRTDKALSFEWLAEKLNKELFEISFILLNPGASRFEYFLNQRKIPVIAIHLKSKLNYPLAFLRLVGCLFKLKPDIIHCHLFDATVLGLLAGKLAGIKRRIFTRHHAMVHYNEFPSGRKWDRLCNFLATDIIAVSKNVEEILIRRDNADPAKVSVIYHGFELPYFLKTDPERILILRKKFRLVDDNFPIVGIISRYLEWKGIHYIIPAFRKLLEKFPKAHLVLANAAGNYLPEIRKMLNELPEDNFSEIVFEEELSSLYRLFNIFIHVPVDPTVEAFGQIYVESLLSGVPS